LSNFRALLVLCLFSALTVTAGVLPPVCVNSVGVYLSGTCGTGPATASFSIDYNGFDVKNGTTYIVPGLSATATFSNFVLDPAANTVSMDMFIKNTSTIESDARLNSLGFETQPDPISGSIINGAVNNPYTAVDLSQTNYPNGIGSVDFCFETGTNCANGSTGLTNGQSTTFTAVLTFADITTSSTLLFQQFVARYSGFNYQVPGGPLLTSGTGIAAVPEPTTYAFLLSLVTSGIVLYRRRSSEK
jgi:hypothetical protein